MAAFLRVPPSPCALGSPRRWGSARGRALGSVPVRTAGHPDRRRVDAEEICPLSTRPRREQADTTRTRGGALLAAGRRGRCEAARLEQGRDRVGRHLIASLRDLLERSDKLGRNACGLGSGEQA